CRDSPDSVSARCSSVIATLPGRRRTLSFSPNPRRCASEKYVVPGESDDSAPSGSSNLHATGRRRMTANTATGQYAAVNGLEMYYEIHGQGTPLVLLHGGLGSGGMFGPVLTELAEHHRVVLPDLQGHGRTADIDRPLDLAYMGDDVAALIDHLDLHRPAVVGYSLGGGVAFQTALRHPHKVGRLVIASAEMRSGAVDPEILAQQGQ